MLSRKEQEERGRPFSDKMIKSIESLLEEAYQFDGRKDNKKLKVFGEFYPNEILLIVSLLEDNRKIPTTCFFSADISNKDDSAILLEKLTNSISYILDMVFTMTHDDLIQEYSDIWARLDSPEGSFFYKMTRENIELTLEANRILDQG